MSPFLTVITRHMPTRPGLLKRNKASLDLQSEPDYEQLIVVDRDGQGFYEVNRQMTEAKPLIGGDYVLLLDDDDYMANEDGIALMKDAVADKPPVLVFKGRHPIGTLPRAHNWMQPPQRGQIGSFDFITRADLFKKHVDIINETVYENDYAPGYSSDFALINELWKRYGPEFAWMDEVICVARTQSLGKSENELNQHHHSDLEPA